MLASNVKVVSALSSCPPVRSYLSLDWEYDVGLDWWCFGRVLGFFSVCLFLVCFFFKHYLSVLHGTSCICFFCSANVQFRLFFPINCGFVCILHTSLVSLVYWFLLWWGVFLLVCWFIFPWNLLVMLVSKQCFTSIWPCKTRWAQNFPKLPEFPASRILFLIYFPFKPWSQRFHYKNIVVFHLKRKVCVPF